ncbi:hypothetical protein Bca4012_007382 [Brassica carinata]
MKSTAIVTRPDGISMSLRSCYVVVVAWPLHNNNVAVSWINNSQHSGGSWIVRDFIGVARVHSRRAFSKSFCPKKTLEQSCNENVLSRSSEALQNLLDYPDVHNEIFKTVSSFDRFKSAAQLCDIFLFFSFPSIVSVSMSLD